MTEGHVLRFPCIRAVGTLLVLLLPLLTVGLAQDLPAYFESNCSTCHGDQGHGNGLNWTNFLPHPANLTLVRDTPDMAYSIVTHGIAGTAMPSSQLSRSDFDLIWTAIEGLPMSTNFQWSNAWTPETGRMSQNLGQTLYVTVCQDCHGTDGQGDGPWASNDPYVWPKPTNFQSRNSDVGRVYYITMYGRTGTMMAPQKNWLNEVGSWAVADYVNGLYKEGSSGTLPVPSQTIPTRSNPISLPNPQAVQNGMEAFNLYCVPCHNADGVGSFLAPNLVDRVWVYGSGTDTAVYTVVEKGIPGKLMPSFKSISEERRWEVITFLRHRGGWPDPILTAANTNMR